MDRCFNFTKFSYIILIFVEIIVIILIILRLLSIYFGTHLFW